MRSAALLALSCSAVVLGAPARAADRAKAERTCVTRREINAISALDDRHAFAKVSAGRFYLVTLDRSCRGLQEARRITIERSESRICGDGTSLVSFELPGAGPVRCRIETIDQVANKDEALDLIESRARAQ